MTALAATTKPTAEATGLVMVASTVRQPGHCPLPAAGARVAAGGQKAPDLSSIIPPDEWETQRPIIETATEEGVPFALGGGLAFSLHACRARNTKDMDLFVLEKDVPHLKRILTRNGFVDYFDTKEYERHWIYRGYKDGVILDIIWQMPNRRTIITPEWHRRSVSVPIHDRCLPLLPAEAVILSKLYVLQKDRCDWPDLLNVLSCRAADLDWGFLIEDMHRDDLRLLGGLLNVFAWMDPAAAGRMPGWVWDRVGISAPEPGGRASVVDVHAPLLDSRDWFGPVAAVPAEDVKGAQED